MEYDMNELSIEEKIGQMIIVGLNTEGAIKHLEEIIQTYKVGGVLLYKKNYKNYEDMIKLINRIKELNRTNKIPMFIAIDQEGGRVNRMPSEFKNLPAANKLAKKSNEENYVKISGDITGQMLNRIGVNMDLAPVLDIKRFPDEHAIGDRAYSENIEEVSKYGIEYMKALQNNNVISVVKHFPGHGATKKDSHFRLSKINCSMEILENEDMVPFKNAMKSGADGVLVGHLKIMNMLGKMPASLSKKFITKYIRKKERYNGLVITDDVRMKGIRMRYGSNRVIKKAFLACNDIIVFKYDNDIQVIKDIIKMAKDNIIEMKKVNKSVTRILKVKEKYQVRDDEIQKDDEFVDKINKEIEEIRQKVL